MKVITGDLIKLALEGQFDVIVHGCNCFHTMGAGIANQIRLQFPEAYQEDQKTPYGDLSKLGTCCIAQTHGIYVVNAYTQYQPGPNLDYSALRKCFKYIGENFSTSRIGYPKIGAGIGGGDWNQISAVIDEELVSCDHTLVIL